MKKTCVFLIVILLSSFIGFAKQNYVKCDADLVNVRAETSISAKIIDSIKLGEIIKVIEESQESILINSVIAKWYKIETKSKITGWVFSGYLSSINGKTIPFGVRNIIGEWLIDDNDGTGEVIFNFYKGGVLIIKGKKSNVFDAKCTWIYNCDKDYIEIIFDDQKQEWRKRIHKLNSDNYGSKYQYISIDESRPSLLIKLTRNYYNEKKKIFENISFPFFGYFVVRRVI